LVALLLHVSDDLGGDFGRGLVDGPVELGALLQLVPQGRRKGVGRDHAAPVAVQVTHQLRAAVAGQRKASVTTPGFVRTQGFFDRRPLGIQQTRPRAAVSRVVARRLQDRIGGRRLFFGRDPQLDRALAADLHQRQGFGQAQGLGAIRLGPLEEGVVATDDRGVDPDGGLDLLDRHPPIFVAAADQALGAPSVGLGQPFQVLIPGAA
jgi:hypothetical protein